MKVWLNGEILAPEDATVSVFDHGLLYGDGVFEGIRIYGGRIFKLTEHLERLYLSAKALALEIPLSLEELAAAAERTLAAAATSDGYIRLVVTRGAGTLGIDPRKCPTPTVFIIVGEIQLYPEEFYLKGIQVITSSVRQIPPGTVDARIKSLNYLPNIMAKLQALRSGCLEAIMLDGEGFVMECSADNIFIVKDGILLTPNPRRGALDGITRRTVLDLAAEIGIHTAEADLTQYDLYTAAECFLTGTGAEIVPVVGIDGRSIGYGDSAGLPGPVTRKLEQAFRDFVTRI